ncbi:protein winged eye isoform X2 [Harmonia axyridis]|uniref:protein winged eye isoform X2 n=1 Tax=Harmonia axyridis TaxID=115357 RepID=UPI001E2776BB|nr:protein winged eye isoform X2 [Harmonia axyridis]
MLYLNRERCYSSMLGSPAGPGAPSQRGLWTSAPLPSATGYTADGFSKYGVYSLFPGGPTFGSALYSHANAFSRFTSGQFQPTPGNIFHGSHKVSDSLFSSTGYTFGVPTPPPGSPYSPIPVAQLELLTKGINSNIIIQQASDFSLSPKKVQISADRSRCDEKCCNVKQKSCLCQDDSSQALRGKFTNGSSGCSRTNPIEWGCVNVKKEPGNPCQVAEITTSISPVIKVEVASPRNGIDKLASPNTGIANGNIPVGIAVARQRIQQPELINSPSLPPAGLLTTVNAAGQIKEIARLSEIESTQADMAASLTAGGAAGGTLLQCSEDRNTALASWPIGGAQSSSLATPTLWQYPAPVPMESMVPLPVPMPPVGFQLVRDPTSGGLLLLPTTTSLEPIQQQTVVWPSYTQQSPLLLPPLPPPPLQLLSSATSDYLSSSATFHQQTQTHSTRLLAVATDTKRKIPLPSTTLIKIEADASSLDQTKTISSMSGTSGAMFSDPSIAPLVTTHVIYQHPPNLILSQPQPVETSCKSQVTSPIPCLTPPPEISSQVEEPPLAVDASNQTDSPICSEDDNTLHTLPEVNIESAHASNEYQEEETEKEDPQMNNTPDEVEQFPAPTEVQTEFEENNEPVNLVVAHVEKEQPKIEEQVEPEVESVKPDLSGLELLSNSIVEFESCRSSIKSEIRSSIDEPEPKEFLQNEEPKEVGQSVTQHKPTEDSLVGLDLLCALAEQRILEESSELGEANAKTSRKEKRKSRRHSDEPRHKKRKSDKYSDEERRFKVDVGLKKSKLKRSASESKSCDNEGDFKCRCRLENYKSCHDPKTEEVVAKYIASKNQNGCCKADWPCMNALELDMRIRLADLQRKFKEKQKELKKLGNKKHRHHSKKRSRKKSSYSDRTETPPPQLDPVETTPDPAEVKGSLLLKPPTLCVAESVKPTKLSVLKKTKTENESTETENYTWCIEEKSKSIKRKSSVEGRRDSHDKERKSSSKKRKVGRPKRISEHYIPTETIVAKKPKTCNFVGYLMAAKEKLQMRLSFSDSPPRFIDESSVFVETKNKNNNNILVRESAKKTNPEMDKTFEDESAWETDMEKEEPDAKLTKKEEDEPVVVKTEVPEEEEPAEEDPHICTLTPEHLEMENLRVLTAMGGLFYAGRMHAVQPPDVYSITLDGERGNRPHIMSREEILRDAIVEIAPKSTEELRPGTRLCAYWSQQYRCLYPGSVAEPETPNQELDPKFVSVEFDDGDNGTISLEDIRLLPLNHPYMDYDPNPLLSLSRRRRRTSSSNANAAVDRRQPDRTASCERVESVNPVLVNLGEASAENHKERKRLKKKKKEKKRRKHRYEGEENFKKHHKKHKKHKKHHHDKENISSSSVDEKDQSTASSSDGGENGNGVEMLYRIEENKLVEEPIEVPQIYEVVKAEPNENEEVSVEDAQTEDDDDDDDDDYVPNPEDEVTIDDVQESPPIKKIRNRQASCESSKSVMSAFLPEKQMWSWSGKETKRVRGKGRKIKYFYGAIQRGKEKISLRDTAVFCSTSKPERPYIGQITSLYEKIGGNKYVKVKWFYHPEETEDNPSLHYTGGVFESSHFDENDVQTISHKCQVVPLANYLEILKDNPELINESSLYYLAGQYEAKEKKLKLFPEIPVNNAN